MLTTPVPAGADSGRERGIQRHRVRSLGLLTLTGFAVAQPLFSLLRRYPEFLVAHRATPGDIVLLTIGLSLVLPLGLALPGVVLSRLTRRLGQASHALFITLLASLWWAQLICHGRGLEGVPAAASILALGIASCWLYLRSATMRRVLAALAAVALCLPFAFLLREPIRGLLSSVAPNEGSGHGLSADTPVVLLVLDELPLTSLMTVHETLDRSRFPNLTRLADDGVWYRNATTVAESTSYAVPAILTGRYPFAERLLPTASHYRTNLFSLLAQSHALHVAETVTALCPSALCGEQQELARAGDPRQALLADVMAIYLNLVIPEGLGYELPQLGDRWTDFWATTDATVDEPAAVEDTDSDKEARRARQSRRRRPRRAFESFITEIEDFPRKTLHYLHVLLPHAPWRYVPSGHSYTPLPNSGAVRDPETGDFTWRGEEWEIAQGLQRHLLQAGFVDRLIGQLLTHLEELDLYDESLIIVVADHGASFRRGHSTRHTGPGGETLVDIANIPLIVKYPDTDGRGIDDSNVESIDILPTVITALGGSASELGIDGLALQGPTRRNGKVIYPSWGPGSARGLALRFPLDRLADRREVLRAQAELFPGEGWQAVYAIGPYPSVIGRKRSQFDHGGDVAFRLDQARALAAAEQQAQSQPLLLSGRLAEPSAESFWMALLVNGRVAAVTRTLLSAPDATTFRALIPPDVLVAGRNRVRAVRLAAPPRPRAGS